MNMDSYLNRALEITIENQDFLDVSMNEIAFSGLVRDAAKLQIDIEKEFGNEGLETLVAELGKKEDWKMARDFFESIFFDD